MRYGFEDFDLDLDLDRFELRRAGQTCHVEPRAFDVLLHLVRSHGRVVTKDELLESVWGHQFVSESALTTRIKALQRVLGDDGRDQRVIRTVRGRGDEFIAPVRISGSERPAGTPGPASEQPLHQEIRFCRAPDGARLADALVGEGAPLVKAANWMTHLDYDWESPVWAHWLRGLARHRRLSTALGARLLKLMSADELDSLRRTAEAELADPGRWGTTFTLIQGWGTVEGDSAPPPPTDRPHREALGPEGCTASPAVSPFVAVFRRERYGRDSGEPRQKFWRLRRRGSTTPGRRPRAGDASALARKERTRCASNLAFPP